jgi:hypothetical protein
MFVSFEDAARIMRLRERVISATCDALKQDGHHKSGEAAVEVTMSIPGMFSDDQSITWSLMVFSYVLGEDRQNNYFGKTLAEAISKAEDAVEKWCFPHEMARFERAVMGGSDGDDEPR